MQFRPPPVSSACEPCSPVCMSMFLLGPVKKWVERGEESFIDHILWSFFYLIFPVSKDALTLPKVLASVGGSPLRRFRSLACWTEMTGSLSCSSHDHMSPVRMKGSRSIHSLSQPPPWFSSACKQSTPLRSYDFRNTPFHFSVTGKCNIWQKFNSIVHILKGVKMNVLSEHKYLTQIKSFCPQRKALIVLWLNAESTPFSLYLVNQSYYISSSSNVHLATIPPHSSYY